MNKNANTSLNMLIQALSNRCLSKKNNNNNIECNNINNNNNNNNNA